MPGLGDEFRAAREARRLSLSDVAERLHIRSVYLQAIEEEDWSAMAAPVYARGFIRAYARLVGVDSQSAVDYYNDSQKTDTFALPTEPEPRVARQVRRSGRPSPWLWAAVLAAAILVGLVGYNLFQLPAESGNDSTIAKRPVSGGTTGGQTLELRLTGKSWISVEVDGNRRLVGTFPAGTHKAFHGKVADVRADDAGAVELLVNGKDLGALGATGIAADRTLSLAEE